MSNRALAVLVVATAFATDTLADTLVLRSGRRVDGDLVSVRGSTVEFEEANGGTRRYDRGDVARIELGSSSYSGGQSLGGRPSGLREKYATVDGRHRVERHRHRRPLGHERLLRGHAAACAGARTARTGRKARAATTTTPTVPSPAAPAARSSAASATRTRS